MKVKIVSACLFASLVGCGSDTTPIDTSKLPPAEAFATIEYGKVPTPAEMKRVKSAIAAAGAVCSEGESDLIASVQKLASDLREKKQIAIHGVELLEALAAILAPTVDGRVRRGACAPVLAGYWSVRTGPSENNHAQYVAVSRYLLLTMTASTKQN